MEVEPDIKTNSKIFYLLLIFISLLFICYKLITITKEISSYIKEDVTTT